MNNYEFSLVDEAYEAKMVGFEIDCNDGKGDVSACHHVGEFYSVVKDNHARSSQIYSDNCLNKKYAPSCFNVGKLYLSGKGVSQSDEEAEKYFDLACKDGHYVACYHLGALRYLAARDSRDDTKAAGILENACNQGNHDSCHMISDHYIKPDSVHRDVSKAITYLKKSCDLNHGPSCYNLAVLFRRGEQGIAPDQEQFQIYKARTEELVKQYGSLKTSRTG